MSATARLESAFPGTYGSILPLTELFVDVLVCDIGHQGEKSNVNKLKELYHQ